MQKVILFPESGNKKPRRALTARFACYNGRAMNARQLLTARDNLTRKIAQIDGVIHEIALSGTSSASISSGGGSKSYTRLDLPSLRSLRSEYAARLAGVETALGGRPSGIVKIMTVRG